MPRQTEQESILQTLLQTLLCGSSALLLHPALQQWVQGLSKWSVACARNRIKFISKEYLLVVHLRLRFALLH